MARTPVPQLPPLIHPIPIPVHPLEGFRTFFVVISPSRKFRFFPARWAFFGFDCYINKACHAKRCRPLNKRRRPRSDQNAFFLS